MLFIDLHTQETQNICITFVQCWTNLEDVGSTLYKYYAIALCLLGRCRGLSEFSEITSAKYCDSAFVIILFHRWLKYLSLVSLLDPN